MEKKWYPTSEGNWFVNPYNFVPLKGVDRRRVDEWRGDKNDRLCGSIHCKLTLKTPLALPDHAHKSMETVIVNGKEEEHPSYPFMSIDGPTIEDRTDPDAGSNRKFIPGSERPFIPGSELRGMIRSVYEAATKSCLSVLDDSPLTGRSYDVKKAGILKKEGDQWNLYSSESKPIKTFNDSRYRFSVSVNGGIRYLNRSNGNSKNRIAKNLSKVCFLTHIIEKTNSKGKKIRTEYVNAICLHDVNRSDKDTLELLKGQQIKPDYDKKKGMQTGYLLIGEIGVEGNSSRHCSHVIADSTTLVRKVEPEEIENLKSVLSFYADEKKNSVKDYGGPEKEVPGEEYYHTGYVDYNLDENQTLPVYYEMVNGVLHLAPAIYSRELYYKTMDEVAGMHTPCSRQGSNGNIDAVCPTCALFGTIREDAKNGRNYGSAVRFGDAIASSCKFVANPDDNKPIAVTLKELAGPKPSAAEFYLRKPRSKFSVRTWNFEYIRTRETVNTTDKYGNPRVRKTIKFFQQPAQLRGRKFYYHWTNVKKEDYSTEVKNGRNVTVDLLEEGTFDFDVFFDGISAKQLNELIWCLSPKAPDDTDALFCHKLGMGKPLGLGSVKVDVEKVTIRKYSADTFEYTTEPYELPNEFAKNIASVNKDLLFMLRFDEFREWSVGYPAQNDGRKGGISYPIADNGEESDENRRASYQWFIGNRQIANDADDPGKGTDPKFCKELPAPQEVAAPDKRLRTLIKE